MGYMMLRLRALEQEGFLLQEVTTGVMSTATDSVVGGGWWAGYWDNRVFYQIWYLLYIVCFQKYFIE